MSPRGERKSASKIKIFGSGAFAAATVLAVVFGIIMISLGRAGYTKDFFSSPPVFTPPASPPVSATPSSSPTYTSTPPATSTPPVSNTIMLGGIAIPASYFSGTALGSAAAPVTIIEFADYQCSICQRFASTTEKDLERVYVATGKVRYIFKNFIVFGDESLLAAQAAEAAAEQNKFWSYHDLLMEGKFSESAPDITLAKLQTLAQIVGLNMDQFNSAMSSGKFKDQVMQDDAEGKALGITGTPTFSVNGSLGKGAIPFDAFQKVIDPILQGTGN
jgi:protein-disulfide isomerase